MIFPVCGASPVMTWGSRWRQVFKCFDQLADPKCLGSPPVTSPGWVSLLGVIPTEGFGGGSRSVNTSGLQKCSPDENTEARRPGLPENAHPPNPFGH